MPIVEVEGQQFEFPDGTSDEIIGQAIRTHFAQQQPQQLGAQDGISGLSGALPSDVVSPIQQQPLAAERFGGGAVRPEVAAAGVVEPALALASGAIAEPIAGLAGLGALPFVGAERAADIVGETREAFTFQPPSEAGQAGLQAVGEALAPIGEAVSSAERALGDATFKATGSPALAAVATALPAAALELIGVKGGGLLGRTARVTPTKGAIKRAVLESAPDIQTLKDTSRAVYRELDNSGVTMKPKVYEGMVSKIRKATKRQGLDVRTTPRAAGALEVLEDTIGSSPSITEIDTLRKVAQGVARNIDPTESALGNLMISEIDDFLDGISPRALNRGGVPARDIAPKYKAARQLWGRARRSELIQEAIVRAKTRASGFENGIRIELDKIVKNKKLSKFFPESEKAAIRDVVEGNTAQNFAKLVGRFGFSEGRATNVLTALGGVGAGGVAGGGIGAFAVPAIGTAARGIAQRLTKNRASFLDAVTRAGTRGEDIAKAYLTATPSARRSIGELSDLLSDPSVDLTQLLTRESRIIREAAEIAEGRRAIGSAAGALAAGTQLQQEQ